MTLRDTTECWLEYRNTCAYIRSEDCEMHFLSVCPIWLLRMTTEKLKALFEIQFKNWVPFALVYLSPGS